VDETSDVLSWWISDDEGCDGWKVDVCPGGCGQSGDDGILSVVVQVEV